MTPPPEGRGVAAAERGELPQREFEQTMGRLLAVDVPGAQPESLRDQADRAAAPGRGEIPRPPVKRARPVDQRVVEVNQKQRHPANPSGRPAGP
jgi:hypothetical protein